MPKYNHMLDVAFTIESEHGDWYKIHSWDLLIALEKRVAYLKKHPLEVHEAFGHSDSYEVEINRITDGSKKPDFKISPKAEKQFSKVFADARKAVYASPKPPKQ